MRLLLAVLSVTLLPTAEAYTSYTTSTGNFVRRTDAANVRFSINQSIAAGVLNADGAAMITGDSEPIAALQAAANTWSNVPGSVVKFAPLDTTSAVNDPEDGRNVIVFTDTPDNRSIVGSALAVTAVIFFKDGRIVDTDIIFNPAETFSTNVAPKTFDLQSVATHEMGHALGANHSGLLAATMFQSTVIQSNTQMTLSADDMAFVADAYPASSARDTYGTISGKVSLTTGDPVPGALLVAADLESGITVGGFSSLADGTYSFQVPRGRYLVYAEPLAGVVLPSNLDLADEKVNAKFQAGFFGGTASPQLVDATSGQGSADIVVAGGAAPFDIQLIGTGSVGGSGDALIGPGVTEVTAGLSVDLIIYGSGLDSSVTQDEVRLLGPGLTIRPNSIRIDPRISIKGVRPIRLTVDVAPRNAPIVASVIVVKDSVAVAFSGSLLVKRGPPEN